MLEYPIIIYIVPLILLSMYVLLRWGRRRVLGRIYSFNHPLTRYVSSYIRKQHDIKWYLNIALAIASIVLIMFSLALPYTIIPRYVKTTQTLEAKISLQRKPPVVIVLDTSGSMKGDKIITAINAVKKFIDQTIDYVLIGLITFNDHVRIAIPPTSDQELLYKKLGEIKAFGGTIYSKPLEIAYDWLVPFAEFNLSPTIIFVTDGLPYSQDAPLYREVVYKCARYNITIYPIFIETPGMSIYETMMAQQRLREIANITKGQFYNVKQTNSLINLFEKLAEKTVSKAGNYILTSNINYKIDVKNYVVEPYILAAFLVFFANMILRSLLYKSTL
ncbi:vWA domain-containing protein [Staphylothermus hellenicus]|nr:VWA domain-containing protein [Staphylothermus hellenicus]